ncbi:MAG: STAS/SEC14 domain-containing protein [Deltaproteobacteria bacterium]|nr:STAS/SEC14 domain-containing protein [Deltaproteobacteria bacterium]
MIGIIPFEEGNIIGFRLNGRIEDEEFDQITEKIEEMLKHYDKLRIYAEIEEIGGMSVNTLMKDIHFKLKHWRNFEKEAVVSDKGWLESWIAVADKIFPSIEIKHFNTNEVEKAKEWLKE